jgi:hypothetical protein
MLEERLERKWLQPWLLNNILLINSGNDHGYKEKDRKKKKKT